MNWIMFADLKPFEIFRLKGKSRWYIKQEPFTVYLELEWPCNAVTYDFPHWAKHFEDDTPVWKSLDLELPEEVADWK